MQDVYKKDLFLIETNSHKSINLEQIKNFIILTLTIYLLNF